MWTVCTCVRAGTEGDRPTERDRDRWGRREERMQKGTAGSVTKTD